MQNILVEQLPIAVEIDGREYEIRTDFRACLNVILAFEDPDLTGQEKAGILLDTLYPELPENLEAAIQTGVQFLDGGHVTEERAGSGAGLRLYSFRKDASYIYSAFLQTHGIDLEAVEHLHWWKFLALFMDLGSETTFGSLCNLRKRLKSGKATKEERQAYREVAHIVDLDEPDPRTPEQVEQEETFMRLIREAEEQRRAENTSV